MSSGFQRYKVAENQKCTEWPRTELEQLTVKSILYTLNTYPWGPNFGPVRSTISRFRNTWSPKIKMHWMTPKWSWTLNSQKYSIYTKYLPLRPKFCFTLKLAVSEIQHAPGLWKSETAPNDPKLNLAVKSTLYVLNTYRRGPNFGPFRSTTSRFRDTR